MIDRGHLKTRMGDDEVELTDAELDALIAAVVAQWESQTSRLWLRRTGYVEEFSLPSRSTILRPSLTPIASVVSVYELDHDPSATPPLNWTLVPSAEYAATSAGLHRLTDGGYFGLWNQRGVRVTYTGGYYPAVAPGATQTNTPRAPDDVLAALYVQAEFMSARTDQKRLVVAESQSMDGNQTRYLRPDFHPLFLETAARYGRIAV